MSEFLKRSLMIFIIKGFRTIVFIFIVISPTFRAICLPAFFKWLSNSGTYTELRTTSFIESTAVACSDSVSHNRVQQDTYRNDYTRCFLKLQRRITWMLQVQSWLLASNNTGIVNTYTRLWLTESEKANSRSL